LRVGLIGMSAMIATRSGHFSLATSGEPARHLPLRPESLSFANARVPGTRRLSVPWKSANR